MALSVLPTIAETETADLFVELQLLFAARPAPGRGAGTTPGHPESDRLPPPEHGTAPGPEGLPGEPVDTSKARPDLGESAGLNRMAWAAAG